MTILLSLCTVFALVLAAYGLAHYFCGLVFLTQRLRARDFNRAGHQAVSVLVPARNEGALAVAALESLLKQEHSGQVDIYLLLKDASDTSLNCLRQLFAQRDDHQLPALALLESLSAAPAELGKRDVIKLYQEGNKTLFLALAGVDPKSEKIN